VRVELEPLTELKDVLREIEDLRRAGAVLAWDQETNMPSAGVAARARQLSTLSRLAHERLTAPATGDLLDAAERSVGDLPYESDDRSLVRVVRRERDQAVKLPARLVAELVQASAEARPVWVKARAENDWSAFAPALERNVRLQREAADALGWERKRYDAFVHRNEPGLTTTDLESLFDELKAAIVPLLHEIGDSGERDALLLKDIPAERQVSFSLEICERLGFDTRRGRQDLSAHPFCTSFSPDDVRMTTRTSDGFGHTLYSSMHETGHALYNQGLAPELQGTPLCYGATSGFHESQSRLWENLVGRSRAFAEWVTPELRVAFPEHYGDLQPEAWYAAVNAVRPGLIRVNADEVTYNLHIVVRFEIENELLDGDLDVADVPEAWNRRMRGYLGIEPPSVGDGPLQDIHWSGFSFGGFPSYTLGNVIGAQLMQVIRRDLPDLDGQVARGEFAPLLGWLQDRVYRHGRKFTPGELLERITGEGLSARAWIDYVREKFST
jgi:carboxypeptidase Taq